MAAYIELTDHHRSKRNREIQDNMNVVRDVCAEMIKEKKERPQSADTPTTDILSAVLSSKTVDFTQSEMVEQLVTFLVAG